MSPFLFGKVGKLEEIVSANNSAKKRINKK